MSYLTIEDTFQFLDKVPNGNLIEFGVFNGNTMNRLIKGAEEKGKQFKLVYGFDSFIGLPKETDGVWNNPEWPEGAFNLCDFYKLDSIDSGIKFARDRIERKDIVLIDGFFDKTLNKYLGEVLRETGSYIHIDVDIHRSTAEVLDFLFTYNIPKLYSIIRYDDWCSTPEYQGGNSLAHKQAEEQFSLKFNRIATNVFQYLGRHD
jgi:hypothetical protein